ncbi:unnamed protein product, partial [marine sediment metagenome]
THYNKTSEGLVELSAASKRGVHWVYMDFDGHLHVVYGQDNYTANEAEEAGVPALLPPVVTTFSVLIAKIIIQKNETAMVITQPWIEAFVSSLATNHNLLGALDGGTIGEYYHMTLAEHTEFQTGYILHSLAAAENDFLVASEANTFVKKTQAETVALITGANFDVGAFDVRGQTLTADGLTSGRVVFTGANGVLSDDAGFLFGSDTLTVNKLTTGGVTSLCDSSGCLV